MTTEMSTLEQTACAILQYHLKDLYDTEVKEWLTHVATDPDYDESCPLWKHPNNYPSFRPDLVGSYPIGQRPNNGYPFYTGPDFTALAQEIGIARAAYADALHRAIINFGMALCTYRSTGRPAPNRTVYLGEIQMISIDLGALICHFHTRIADACSYAVRMLDSFDTTKSWSKREKTDDPETRTRDFDQ